MFPSRLPHAPSPIQSTMLPRIEIPFSQVRSICSNAPMEHEPRLGTCLSRGRSVAPPARNRVQRVLPLIIESIIRRAFLESFLGGFASWGIMPFSQSPPPSRPCSTKYRQHVLHFCSGTLNSILSRAQLSRYQPQAVNPAIKTLPPPFRDGKSICHRIPLHITPVITSLISGTSLDPSEIHNPVLQYLPCSLFLLFSVVNFQPQSSSSREPSRLVRLPPPPFCPQPTHQPTTSTHLYGIFVLSSVGLCPRVASPKSPLEHRLRLLSWAL
ncbi:hypothetical protein SODALDRAFT_46335 [Sodiomyces alkalinus F11]|uniref:Uncharacterized protein n=1 Tax=Sodiomyces alkalinus (strain CBS 110278 / VKM F-3762 / F11) TaxID=1314773 RepID=A0A3N2QAN1_SODAK|nr:hypothetical protein SODALDRAFT_46335 [Sodiomyces alkalinus F11]ROT43728.1 hypothetical protein SODALDRAFT_46335 [Sodiomyces alkalinus F11]